MVCEWVEGQAPRLTAEGLQSRKSGVQVKEVITG